MEVRDIVQAIFGAIVLSPDEVLLSSAVNNSFLFSRFVGPGGLDQVSMTLLGVFHVLVLIFGAGLLIGVGPVASAAIALLVVLGVAGGLFAVGQIMEIVGPQVAGISQNVSGAIGSLVVQPYFADLYIFLPLVVLGAGALRWRYTAKLKRRRAAGVTQASLRQHCTRCGARVEATASKCKACGKQISAKAEKFCIECGKGVEKDAAYCGYCGAEVLHGDEVKCANCNGGVPSASKYCFHCGARLRTGPDGGERTPTATST